MILTQNGYTPTLFGKKGHTLMIFGQKRISGKVCFACGVLSQSSSGPKERLPHRTYLSVLSVVLGQKVLPVVAGTGKTAAVV